MDWFWTPSALNEALELQPAYSGMPFTWRSNFTQSPILKGWVLKIIIINIPYNNHVFLMNSRVGSYSSFFNSEKQAEWEETAF